MKHVFRFEWLHTKNSGRFWVTALMLPALIGFSLYLGSERVEQQHHTIQELRTAEASFYEGKKLELQAIERGEAEADVWWQNPANPLALGQFRGSGKHVFLEPRPLAALAAGQLDIRPYYGRVTMMDVQPLRDNALENPFIQAVGVFDFAFVLVWLVPLFVIVFGYNMLSSERELGTWALLKSQPVSIHKILVYKLIFRFLQILLIVFLSLILWAIFLGINLFHTDSFLLLGAITLYILFWFALCALFNMLATSSAVNAVSLAGIWVLFLLLIPSVISMLASAIHPVPSRALWITEQRAIQQAVEAEGDALYDLWQAEHPEEFVEGETPSFYQTWMQLFVTNSETTRRERVAALYFSEPAESQAALVSSLRPLSPPMWLQSWLERKAGTDAGRLKALDAELADFQEEGNDFFLPRFQRLEFLSSEEYELIPSP